MSLRKILIILAISSPVLHSNDCSKRCAEVVEAADSVIALIEKRSETLQQLNLTLVNQNSSLLDQNISLVKRDEKFFTHPAFVLLVGFIGGLLIHDRLADK